MRLPFITPWLNERRRRREIRDAARCYSTEQIAAALARMGAPARARLADRRQGRSETIPYRQASGNVLAVEATFNCGADGAVREVFGRIPSFRNGAEMLELLGHACTVASIGLQYGANVREYLHAMGEDDPDSHPASALAAILRAAAGIASPELGDT